MRISINLGEDILNKVDEEAKRLGVPRGSMLSAWIGEKINTIEMTRNMMKDILNDPVSMEALKSLVSAKTKGEE